MSTKGQEALRGKGRKKARSEKESCGRGEEETAASDCAGRGNAAEDETWYAVGLGKREARVYPRSKRTLPFKRDRKGKNIQNYFLGGGLGNLSQEQIRRACDAGTVNVVRGVSMRKPSGVGHTIRNKPGVFETREQPIW